MATTSSSTSGPLWNDTLKRRRRSGATSSRPSGTSTTGAWPTSRSATEPTRSSRTTARRRTCPPTTSPSTRSPLAVWRRRRAPSSRSPSSASGVRRPPSHGHDHAEPGPESSWPHDVAEDDLCTITETNTAGATSTTFQVTGGTVDSTTATSVTVAAGANVAIVATNAYPEPRRRPQRRRRRPRSVRRRSPTRRRLLRRRSPESSSPAPARRLTSGTCSLAAPSSWAGCACTGRQCDDWCTAAAESNTITPDGTGRPTCVGMSHWSRSVSDDLNRLA